MKSLLIFFTFTVCSLHAVYQDVFIVATKDKVTDYYVMSIKRNSGGVMDVFERVTLPMDSSKCFAGKLFIGKK